MRHESAGAIVLGVAALAALILSNSSLAGWYEALLRTPGELVIGKTLVLEKTLLVWVNDLWMAVFFFLVGLEIKREFDLVGAGRRGDPACRSPPQAWAFGCDMSRSV